MKTLPQQQQRILIWIIIMTLSKKIKDEINNSPQNQDTNEINNNSDFIELYNKKFSKNNLSFIGKERKYITFLPMYFFIKKLKPISFIDNLT